MKKRKNYTKEEYEKVMNSITNSMIKCKCGKVTTLPPDKEKIVCSNCYRTLYNHTKARLRYIIFKQQNNKEN